MREWIFRRPRFLSRQENGREEQVLWQPGQWKQLVSPLLILAGVTIGGALAAWNNHDANSFFRHYTQEVLARHNNGFLSVLADSFLSSMGILTILALMGTCCFGAPLICVTLLLRSISMGSLTAGLYEAWGIRGIAANLVLLLGPALIQFWAFTDMTNSVLDTSRTLFLENCMRRNLVTRSDIKMQQMGRRYLFNGFILLGAAALEALLAALFGALFAGIAV